MTRRLLLVEPSTTMRHVLESHVRSLGYRVDATDTYAGALAALEKQFRAFESDFAGVLHGWPSLPDADAETFAERLEDADFEDLPVVVMSTDMRAETRAWVAGRERTAVLAWKDYLGVEALLERLLDEGENGGATRVSKFDNADIHVLVVDDSLTIRYSLRDLLELQGYRVTLAATREEALAAARRERFDIAVLDFYLEETTGDALCRDLVSDPACGDLVCAILTGTYADHVIKRSLRAGAVECMFKNESSELLLTRIDAISRFVRQRRELAVGLGQLERVVEALAGSVLLVDERSRVRHASAAALADLGVGEARAVLGRGVQELVGVDELPPADATEPVAMRWRDASGREFPVSVSRLAMSGGESLIGFERLDSRGAVPGETGPQRIVRELGLPPASLPFVERLERHVADLAARAPTADEGPGAGGPNGTGAGASLLVIGLHERVESGAHVALDPDDERAIRIERGLRALYRREHHVAPLGGHRFGMLIRHSDEPQSYLLTRRLMQLADELLLADGGPRLASTGCLVALDGSGRRTAASVLEHALSGLAIVDARGVDQALLLDLRRMLAVYPKVNRPRSDEPSDVTS